MNRCAVMFLEVLRSAQGQNVIVSLPAAPASDRNAGSLAPSPVMNVNEPRFAWTRPSFSRAASVPIPVQTTARHRLDRTWLTVEGIEVGSVISALRRTAEPNLAATVLASSVE